jgi:hypothetical protein
MSNWNRRIKRMHKEWMRTTLIKCHFNVVETDLSLYSQKNPRIRGNSVVLFNNFSKKEINEIVVINSAEEMVALFGQPRHFLSDEPIQEFFTKNEPDTKVDI